MASSPNVRPYPNSATGADAESASAALTLPLRPPLPLPLPPLPLPLPPPPRPKIRVVWKRPNMRGSKCSINGYVRLGIVKTITAELRSVGDDTFREFRESCLGHFIREERGGFVSNAALNALFSNEVVRPDSQVDEFWFRIGHRLIRFSRYDYALVTGLRFGDSDFDVHGDDMLDRIRDRFAGGYSREQSGDALKVAKVLCVCYLIFGVDGGKRIADSDIWACEAIPSLGSKCGIMLGASFIQRPCCKRWKLKKLGHIDFTTFFDDEIDCFEVLSPTPEEEQEPYMQSISDASSERVQYTHRMALCKRGGRGRGKGKGKGRARDGDASVGDLVGERIVRQRTSGPVISAHYILLLGVSHQASLMTLCILLISARVLRYGVLARLHLLRHRVLRRLHPLLILILFSPICIHVSSQRSRRCVNMLMP
ncbi:hypothetical protein OROMI_000902 [Orobanche minor]